MNRIIRKTGRRLPLCALTVVVLVLAACSSTSSGKATFSTANGPAAATTPTSQPPSSTSHGSSSGCGSVQAGQGGIIQVFCNGPGDAKITMGSASKELTGGSCTEQSGQFAINFGAVAGPDFPAGQTKPDYLGALVEDGSGTLNAFTVIINGTSSGVIVNRTATVSADKKSATLKGQRLSDSAPVTVTVTC